MNEAKRASVSFIFFWMSALAWKPYTSGAAMSGSVLMYLVHDMVPVGRRP